MRQLKAFLACVLAMLQQMLSATQTLLAIYGGSSSTAGEDDAGSSSTEPDSSVGGGNRGAAGTVNASGNSGGGVSPAIVRQLRVAQVAAAAALLAVRSMLRKLERATGGVPHQMAQDVQHVWTEGGVQYEIDQLAAALQAAWAEPAPMAHEDVEAAEMAAGSSCAYLRCSNLGGEGGLAAGQGVGSKRCRCGGQGLAVVRMRVLLRAVASRWVMHHPLQSLLQQLAELTSSVSAPIHFTLQRMPRGVVLWHRLLARLLAARRAQNTRARCWRRCGSRPRNKGQQSGSRKPSRACDVIHVHAHAVVGRAGAVGLAASPRAVAAGAAAKSATNP